MKLSACLITGALLLAQLTLSVGAFIPPAAAQTAQVQLQELAPPLNKQKLPRPDSTNAMLQKASQLHASLTPAQRQSAKEILERYTPQLKELGEQLKAASPRPTQSPQRLETAPDLVQMEEVAGRIQGVQDQIAVELSLLLSEEQLQQYRAVIKPLESNKTGSASTQNGPLPHPCAPYAYYGMVYSMNTYYIAMNGYHLGGGQQGGNVNAFWAAYHSHWAYKYSYAMYYYNEVQSINAFSANQASLYANAYSQDWNSGTLGELAAESAANALQFVTSASLCYS